MKKLTFEASRPPAVSPKQAIAPLVVPRLRSRTKEPGPRHRRRQPFARNQGERCRIPLEGWMLM